ncbi:MAG: 2-C-methyl-D-erythritol 4-phosphate cytidylyltransferase [Candidatus Omnitrophica bacterium]|nr:2-C-methyl-D-erythritol 4-phosphate cytidylyltransferase [Candidatus Omnitrophota bacterium]MBU1933480.1 2-C-methyl-D-erythritol 4-phosphate cytidylyltransferase [Candidatus Omnitrophota bacterium]
MRVAAIVPSAGKGTRIKSRIEKPYIKINGKPILARTLLRLSHNSNIKEIIIAVSPNRVRRAQRDIINRYGIRNAKVVRGGKERIDSVARALESVSPDIGYVLIHDGIRPFIDDALINACLKAAMKFGAAVAGVPVKPTLKITGKDGRINHTPDRRDFWEAQTPQVFKRDLIEKAYKKFYKRDINITDDSMLVEMMGIRPKIIMGSYSNIKITTREDLELAKLLLKNPNDKIQNSKK